MYGPPEIFSSEEEDDEFMFSCDNYDKDGRRIKPVPVVVENKELDMAQELYSCFAKGNVDEFRITWDKYKSQLNVDEPMYSYGHTPLMLACQDRNVELVRYLLFELRADPNANSNDMTALILACMGTFDIDGLRDNVSPEEESDVLQICKMLVEKRAMVGKANLRRETALMHAAANGYLSVIQFLLDKKAALQACDNENKTALFFAIANNRYEATKMLLDKGAMTDVRDRDDQTPKKLAEVLCFDDIIELFPPDPVVPMVPNHVCFYGDYRDLIPTAFPDKEAPPYSPDVYTMLTGMQVKEMEYNFYEAGVGLPEFLLMTDQRLQDIGIEFPYKRKRILLGLLRFHFQMWSKSSIPAPALDTGIENHFEVFSNCLKQIIIIKAAMDFVDKHEIFTKNEQLHQISDGIRQEINQELMTLQTTALLLLQTMQDTEKAAADRPPVHISKSVIDDICDMKSTFRMQLHRKIKWFTYLGLGVAAAVVIKLRYR